MRITLAGLIAAAAVALMPATDAVQAPWADGPFKPGAVVADGPYEPGAVPAASPLTVTSLDCPPPAQPDGMSPNPWETNGTC